MEYPGYSLYQGEPSEEAITRDADGLYLFATRVLNFRPENVYLIGRSLGTGSCCFLGSKRPAGLTVLISPFTSIKEAARHNYTWIVSSLVKNQFDNATRIKSMMSPVLFIHGKDDDVVPVDHSKDLIRSRD